MGDDSSRDAAVAKQAFLVRWCRREQRSLEHHIGHNDQQCRDACAILRRSLIQLLTEADSTDLLGPVMREPSQSPLSMIGMLEAVAVGLEDMLLPSRRAEAPQVDTNADLMTAEEISQLVRRSPKTLLNSRVMGEPAIKGGGRGKPHKWHYEDAKLRLEQALGQTLPNLDEARRILSQKP